MTLMICCNVAGTTV